MINLTAQKLAEILYKELEADNWGDIDPYIFKEIALQEKGWTDNEEYVPFMEKLLERVIEKINEENDVDPEEFDYSDDKESYIFKSEDKT